MAQDAAIRGYLPVISNVALKATAISWVPASTGVQASWA
jgi:hypothetical protein